MTRVVSTYLIEGTPYLPKIDDLVEELQKYSLKENENYEKLTEKIRNDLVN